jgi:hypothetical protein
VQSRQRDTSEVGIVFWVSAAFALAFILWGVIAPENFGAVTQTTFDWIVTNLGWFYLLAGNFFLAFVVILAPLVRATFGHVEREVYPWNIPPALLLRNSTQQSGSGADVEHGLPPGPQRLSVSPACSVTGHAVHDNHVGLDEIVNVPPQVLLGHIVQPRVLTDLGIDLIPRPSDS